jgi:hypothetical protein
MPDMTLEQFVNRLSFTWHLRKDVRDELRALRRDLAER